MSDFFRLSSWMRTSFVMIAVTFVYLYSLTFSFVGYLFIGITILIMNIFLIPFSLSYEILGENHPIISSVLFLSIFIFIISLPIFYIFRTNWLTELTLKQLKAVEIGKDTMPSTHEIMLRLARKADIPKPKIYLTNNPDPNACALGHDPSHGIIVLSKGLLDTLNNRELTGVLAHELAHIKNRDTSTNVAAMQMMKLAVIIPAIMSSIMFIGGGILHVISNDKENYLCFVYGALWAGISSLIGFIGTILTMSMSRTREFTADRTGAKISGDPLGLISALLKIEERTKCMKAKVSPQAAHLFIFNPISSKSLCSRIFSTHPTVERRVERLKRMAISGPESES